jgi:phage/conjugal plasmid C-4 type zinc finger TraR family protein
VRANKEAFLFEVHCGKCGYFQLWGLEQAIRGLIQAGKLRLESDIDVVLVGELFRVHCGAILCPGCGEVGTLSQTSPKKHQWTWADEVRCEDCGHEIPPERLAAVPGVSRCVTCQREFALYLK